MDSGHAERFDRKVQRSSPLTLWVSRLAILVRGSLAKHSSGIRGASEAFYTKRMRRNGDTLRDLEHEAIVSHDVFNQVQQRLARNGRCGGSRVCNKHGTARRATAPYRIRTRRRAIDSSRDFLSTKAPVFLQQQVRRPTIKSDSDLFSSVRSTTSGCGVATNS